MTEISNISANNLSRYISKNQTSFGNQQSVAYASPEVIECDTFEHSEDKSTGEKAAIATGIALPITVATLWLTKGKGWAKIKNLFKPKAPDKVIPRKKYTKPGLEIRENIRNEDSGLITRNANNKSRNLVDRANLDTPTPAQQAAYDKQIAYKAPTKEEAQIIKQVRTEANKESAISRQVQNNISQGEQQALQNVRKAAEATAKEAKTGLFKTKDGFTVKLEGGNIKEITTPDGRVITKLKTIDKYQDKIDMSNLKAVK